MRLCIFRLGSRRKSASPLSPQPGNSRSPVGPPVPEGLPPSTIAPTCTPTCENEASPPQTPPTFFLFPELPPELRLRIWELAMEEPTEVNVCVSSYTPPHGPNPSRALLLEFAMEGNIGTPHDYRPSASLPPLMLVNHESHSLAKAHYRRAFKSISGEGGVLAAYPVVLYVDPDAASLLQAADLKLAREIHVQYQNGSLTHYPEGHLKTIINAPRLELLSFETDTTYAYGVEMSFCISFRNFCSEVISRNPNRNIPEIEVNVKARDGGKPFYFRGNWLDMPY